MKRDMDLIRRIVLAVRDLEPGQGLQDLDDVSAAAFGEHSKLLIDDGFVEGVDVTSMSDLHRSFILERLTSKGHDFADAIGSDTVWASVMTKTRAIGAWTLGVVWDLARSELKRRLGLSE